MTRLPGLGCRAALLVLGLLPSLRGQELSLVGGGMRNADKEQTSFTWQVDYRQLFTPHFATSVTYLNEGHVPGHHRDGTAFEAWGRLPAGGRCTLSLGVGLYFFYDTQLLPGGGSANSHGTAPLASLSASGPLGGRWRYQATFHHVHPARAMRTDTLAVGAGYWFGTEADANAPGEPATAPHDELTLLGGRSVVNTFLSEEANASSLEYRRTLWPHVEWTASAVYEGNPRIVRRSGLAAQVWAVNDFLGDRVSVGIGFGPYLFIDSRHPTRADDRNPALVAPLVSLTVARRISEDWALRLLFHRVATSYNRDSDVFLLGLGRRWQRP